MTPGSIAIQSPPSRVAIRLEQFRQAARIHKGFAGFCTAVLAVWLSRLPIPSRRLRGRLWRDLYARMYPPGLDEREAEFPLSEYGSFNRLFTRGLKPEARPIALDPDVLTCPCDGRVQDVGRITDGTLLTIKGIAYSVGSLLAAADVSAFEGGRYVIIFLSPIDCHRVFSPADGTLDRVTHIPGARLLVHPPFQRPEFPVYTLNERAIFDLTTSGGPCALVMVAGWGVGHMTMPARPRSHERAGRVRSRTWDTAPTYRRGEWLATFELGSTVILLTGGRCDSTPLVSPNEEVRIGQPIFRNGPSRPAP